jgi:hypothetical protein
MSTPKGFVFYEGPSAIDGQPIAAIARLQSSNRKTGDMVQTWIMRSDISPLEALETGADESVCGDCRHRPTIRKRAAKPAAPCYVQVGRAPSRVWDAYHRGVYPRLILPRELDPLLSDRGLRLGSWGDPAAVPEKYWRPLIDAAEYRTGYTHRSDRPEGEWLRGLAMASADSQAFARRMQRRGWATFRVADRGNASRMRGEARCPASAEAGNLTTCAACPIKCDGSRGAILGRVIQAH